MVSFSLPTVDREGEFSIRNYNNELTLKQALEGFGVSTSVTELPMLSEVLKITLKMISLTINHECSISKAELTIYKEEIHLSDSITRDISPYGLDNVMYTRC